MKVSDDSLRLKQPGDWVQVAGRWHRVNGRGTVEQVSWPEVLWVALRFRLVGARLRRGS